MERERSEVAASPLVERWQQQGGQATGALLHLSGADPANDDLINASFTGHTAKWAMRLRYDEGNAT